MRWKPVPSASAPRKPKSNANGSRNPAGRPLDLCRLTSSNSRCTGERATSSDSNLKTRPTYGRNVSAVYSSITNFIGKSVAVDITLQLLSQGHRPVPACQGTCEGIRGKSAKSGCIAFHRGASEDQARVRSRAALQGKLGIRIGGNLAFQAQLDGRLIERRHGLTQITLTRDQGAGTLRAACETVGRAHEHRPIQPEAVS